MEGFVLSPHPALVYKPQKNRYEDCIKEFFKSFKASNVGIRSYLILMLLDHHYSSTDVENSDGRL